MGNPLGTLPPPKIFFEAHQRFGRNSLSLWNFEEIFSEPGPPKSSLSFSGINFEIEDFSIFAGQKYTAVQ